jgi:hypothetical protein
MLLQSQAKSTKKRFELKIKGKTWLLLASLIVLGLALLLAGCGTNQSGQSSTTPNTGSESSDLYQNYTPRQVIDTYLAAYQKGDYATCFLLLSPIMADGLETFTLKATQARTELGAMESYTVEGEYSAGSYLLYSVTARYSSQKSNSMPNEFKVERTGQAWKLTSLLYF